MLYRIMMFALKSGAMLAVLFSVQFDHESINSLGFEVIGPTGIYTHPRPLRGVYAVLDLGNRQDSSYTSNFPCHSGTGHLFCRNEMLGFTGT